MADKPNCYQCIHRRDLPGDCHSRCEARDSKVEGHPIGIQGGWFFWPHNFDPTWLVKCSRFEPTPKQAKNAESAA